MCMVKYYPMFIPVEGYGYGGFQAFWGAISLVSLFYFIPFNKLPEKLLKVIMHLTRFTMGVYGMHMMVGRLMNIMFAKYGIAVNTLKGCILIYFLCYAMSYLLSKIPVRIVKQLVE